MKYKHDQYNINKLCEFINKDIETDFQEHDKVTNFNFTRIVLLSLGFVYTAFIFSAYFFIGRGTIFFVSLGLRCFCLVLAVIASSVLGLFKSYKKTLFFITAIELVIFGIYLFDLYIMESTQFAMQFMTVMLFILVVFVTPNLWKNSLAAGFAIMGGYFIYSVVFRLPVETPNLIQREIFLIICFVSFATFMFRNGYFQRRQFAAEKLLEFIAITDRLTGIYNRNRFEYILGLWIKNMRHDPFCLVLYDIDNFKNINDTYGHNEGDLVLTSTAEIITSHIRDNDIFARWGGEEFVILFSNTEIVRARELADRLRKAVEAHDFGQAGKVTISIGVAQYHREKKNTDTNPITDLIERADAKMYEAKRAGKNCVVTEEPTDYR